MDKLFLLGLNREEKQKIGVKLGADVPAAFFDNPLIARGIGEEIEEIHANFRYYVVLIKPDFSCNTKEMYQKLDTMTEINQKYNSEIVKDGIINKDIKILSENLYNVFESSVQGIDKIKEELINVGALGSLMSGSGSCIYGIFNDRVKAKSAFKILNRKYDTYFCITK